MKNLFAIFCGTLVLAIGACAMSPKTLPPGEYTHTESSTTPSGTATEKTVNTDVYYDQYGHKHAVQEVETTRDPPGLLNKKTTTTKKTY